jgi:outer membrane lipopolysaccharide assembly protein LptE/RlpB
MRVWLFSLVLGCSVLLSGCSHYQLGTSGKLSFATLYVEPATNRTLLPQAQAIVTTQIRQAFLQDGRVAQTSAPDAADAVLEIRIQDYHRDVASVLENDTGLARKFTLTLEVACTLRSKGTVLFQDRVIRVQRDAFTDGGLLQSEYQTLPILAEALGKKVAHAVLDVW